ncbi:hypothetical protein [Pseudorhodoplanes sp.]|uniref:hypothetical protein n=1 Tax=Pseudorhodoplanes sp. TaxID=1934341 RepID=UPI002B7162DC|nr:hypothetical protein [Pseudorhodoplanes sp.]HWV52268.1 hypothetical protein [Pseudorhodoplanes sp.]
MSTEPLKDADGKPLDPAAQAVVNKVRRMSMLSAIATVLGISVVVVLVGLRIYRSADAPPAQSDIVATLPKGAKVMSTAVTANRVVVTVDIGGVVELRTFDASTLQPVGRLRFVEER